jgi:hypothetical protein
LKNLESPISRKTRSVSYRIDSKVLDEVVREANNRDTSPNLLVNQILRRFIEFDRYQHRLGTIPFPKEMLREIIDAGDDQYLSNLASQAFKFLTESAILMQQNQDLVATLSLLKEYVKVGGIACDHIKKGGKDIIVIQHDMGSKTSLFVKDLLSMVFEKFLIERPIFEMTDSAVVVTANLPDMIHSHLSG